MAERQTVPSSTDDYTTGTPRKHYSLYLEDGNFVIQVQNAIFKVHRSLLARYSTVIQTMLDVPNENGSRDGTDDNPLILTGDSVAGWESLLGLQYNRPLVNSQGLNGEEMLLVLPIAHKYCMEGVEADIMKGLKNSTSDDNYIDLMVAARIVGSEELHQGALEAFILSGTPLSVGQAKRIGAEATSTIMKAAATVLQKSYTRAVADVTKETKSNMAAVEAEFKSAFCQERQPQMSALSTPYQLDMPKLPHKSNLAPSKTAHGTEDVARNLESIPYNQHAKVRGRGCQITTR